MSCTAHRARSFAPPVETQAAASLEAWKRAVERADSMLPGRLLYEARLTQGLASVPGTLAVRHSPGAIEAVLTGPFGTLMATYADGALRGEGIRPVDISPGALGSLLAGVWRQGEPEVQGFEGGDALLVWNGPERVEAILDLADARTRSLAVSRPQGKILATYSGSFDPWPARIQVVDAKTGAKMRLTLIGKE